MKWNKPGHEFDELGGKFIKNRKLIVIGDDFDQASFYLNRRITDVLQFLNVPVKLVKFSIKNLQKKWFTKLIIHMLNFKYKLFKQHAVIITHYKYQDVNKAIMLRNILKEIFPNLMVYDSTEFLEKQMSIFAAYVQDKIYVRDTCIIVTTGCTLNCKYCLNFTPFIKHAKSISLEKLKEEADIYFKVVDYVGFFQISGGEPLTYKYLAEYIEWVAEKYSNQIGQILLATNGTLLPDERLANVLKKYGVILLLDNYTQAVPSTKPTRDKLINFLEEHGIDSRDYGENQQFFKFFPANEDYSKLSEKELSERADKCWGLQPWRNLRDGRIYYCNFSSFAVTAGIIQDDPRNYMDLKNFDCSKKKELLEFFMGYSVLGYDTFCTLCNGINESNTLERRPAGEQAKGKFGWHSGMTLSEFEEMNL
ncbi:MAG: radical SAM protein [Alphaproteobacteria bacterium]|nr:radical SAM protein [Alphaproteobacteria bacterium]